MATRKGAGALNNIVVFQQREAVRDEGGGTSQDWVDKFETAARLQPRLGSESDIAARTQGIQPYTLIVRSETRTRNITPSWRARNKRTGVLYEIQSCANPDEVNQYIEMRAVVQGGG
ncbi:head-tail adaptor protein [Brucella pseudogrignonensis]|uniref:head-tail adaptor protein n=1 Tax=Brucella pseudogrignonensis TaxID=419475 RepID=UPI003B9FCFC1